MYYTYKRREKYGKNKKFIEEIKEKEFDTWCKMLLDYTQAMVDNPTVANKWIFDKACHDK